MHNNRREKEALSIIEGMSIEEKVGQLFILAFPGKDPSILSDITSRYGIAGCYISQDNAETFLEASELTKRLHDFSYKKIENLPLILGVDQEGAWGVLIPESTIGPGNLALGMSEETSDTETLYRIFAREMASVGYTAILAPSADINLNPLNPIIGTRSFGEEAKRVSKHVTTAVQAIRQAGILSAAKHFPGHGDTHVDTHREIPTVDKPMDLLFKQELLPFQAAIDAGVDMIMTSHILFPQWDKKLPATLSSKILTHLLRVTMGFEGIIITDSMNMGAIRKHYSPEQASVMAFLAGADLIMLSEEHYDHSSEYLDKQIASIEGIIAAVKDGRISQDVLHDRVLRILKKRLQLRDAFQSKNTAIYRELKTHDFQSNKQNAEQAAKRAIRILRNKNAILPLAQDKTIVLLNCTPQASYHNLMNIRGIGPNQAKPAFESFCEEFRTHREASILCFEDIQKNGLDTLEGCDLLIAVTEDYPLPGEDFEKEDQQALVGRLIKAFNEKLLVLGLRSAYELDQYPDLLAYVSSYSSRSISAEAAGKLLCSADFGGKK